MTIQIFVNGKVLDKNNSLSVDDPAVMLKEKGSLNLPTKAVHGIEIVDENGKVVAKLISVAKKSSPQSPCSSVMCWLETDYKIVEVTRR